MFIYDDGVGRVELVDHMGTDLSVVNAARVSYGKRKNKLDEKDIKLIKYLLSHRHTSPLESCQITFLFVVPLFVRSQHHRHRTWAYSEVSRRFTAENIQFYYPKEWRGQDEKNKQGSAGILSKAHQSILDINIRTYCEDSLNLYNKMLKDGVSREMARMVLPQNLYTQYYGSVNLHNALHFLSLRLDYHSQWEIQQVAKAMLEILEGLYPETIKIWKELRSSS